MATIALQKKMNATMNELQIKSDAHIRQMIMERKRVDDLEDALRRADEQIKVFRLSAKETALGLLNHHRATMLPHTAKEEAPKLRTDGANAGKLAEQSQKKLISNLEHKLDKLKIRLSQTETHNEELRKQIDNYRRHRMTSDKNKSRIEGKILDTQKKVKLVLEKSRQTSEARERLVEETNEINREQAEERGKFIEQMKALSEYIDKQNREFEESIQAAGVEKNPSAENCPEEFFITRGNMTIDEEKMKMELVCEIETQIETEKESMKQTEMKIKKYKDSFDELKRVSGIDDVKEIVQQYVKSEEETFSLFNYIQAQNQETDWTLERLARLEEDIRAYEDALSEEEASRAQAMADLQGKWRNAKEATDECSHAAEEAQRTLQRIAKKIHSLFFKIQCDQLLTSSGGGFGGKIARESASSKGPASLDHAAVTSDTTAASTSAASSRPTGENRLAILSGQGVTESNILAFAELIERRALEIVAEYIRRLNQHEPRNVITVLEPSKSLSPNGLRPDWIKPPDVENPENKSGGGGVSQPDGGDDPDDDDDGRPIALDEMRRRTAEILAKKQQGIKLNLKHRNNNNAGGSGPATPAKSVASALRNAALSPK